jgi:glucosamine kinase
VSSMKLFIGVDGGGTWTKGAICDADGAVLAVAASGSSHPDVVGVDTAAENVRTVLSDLAERTHHIGELSGICVSGTSQAVCDLARLQEHQHVPSMRTGDALAAFHSAPTQSERGVVVVLGTGSAAERSDGTRTIGGWGWMLGDEGGGTWMGRQAARTALQMLRTNERSLLGELVLARCGGTAEAMFEFVYRSESVPGALGQLAHLVTRCAENGDAKAMAIVERAVGYAWDLATELLEPNDDVVFVGNVARAIEHDLRQAAPEGTQMFVVPYGVTGTLVLAAELGYVDLDRESVARSLAELHGHLTPPAMLERVPARHVVAV